MQKSDKLQKLFVNWLIYLLDEHYGVKRLHAPTCTALVRQIRVYVNSQPRQYCFLCILPDWRRL
jgi:hypothetical protein